MAVGDGESGLSSKSERAAGERRRWLARLRAAQGCYEDEPAECYRCGSIYARRALAAIQEIPGYRWPRYCPECVEAIRAAHGRRCVLCGTLYLGATAGAQHDYLAWASSSSNAPGLCPGCDTRERQREWNRVRYHLCRARLLGLPATLTLGEWLRTVGHFGGGCAYCGAQPFSDLDHFLPLAAGGGTTAANCVPACSVCNNLKRAVDPGRPPWARLPRAAVERVGEYLRTLSGRD